ncbi:MAG TPA: SDR family NAD(P)-dependent oxidoreductase [Polaromonas sp.]|uniref:SDR family NAD(P)-dependent oxidoreductase n=1 Tax=unclassified Polaromonas TaxID=2638319 RepID=UPI000BD20C20|nr:MULTISPECIES: SDR family NAD(P)-dependent oxidoreductase [unclassified Polaromonas]OYY39296.1 MAG: short-chain dehydrogenase [Polaromonas sp. 35-63-35]OYZ20395.1 MAG: short-chain dehydrogenase [Polaromonas sp. 16-63-31]OYZ80602.1 MAG: short-chain dehydrogenase [Polaromonas sp. 24-63-21]OZA51663.1 MAG: short-chain dehydrogenase [Polaromonas sp. 17-63-33]OZA89866.1 MAG: short-chain dehydrogenase [Polaromonas sp. 39-63-25]
MLDDLREKTILITGAAGGIGSETARVCAAMGAHLVLLDRDEPLAFAEELRKSCGVTVITRALDVRDRPATEKLLNELERLDAVVANAGFCPWDDWNDADWDDVFRQVVDINLLGVINLVRPAMAKMAYTGKGKIVLVSSVAARMGGLKASPHYVAAKGGVSALVKWLARKGAQAGINVNCVAPGASVTAMTASTSIDTSGIPMGRMSSAREIALPIAFLCTNGANYMCGATIDVNGGVYMP